jgi:hypothetical protein
MNVIKFLAKVLVHLLKVLAYRWAIDGADLVKRLIEAIKNSCARLKLPHADQESGGKDPCKVDHPAFHRPDPCIYSQQYLLSLGLPVTWDNPDIVLRRGGVIVAENDLLPNTDYEIGATIWNNSYEAPCVGLKVIFSYLSFGVATVSNAIGTTFVNLGVKGGVNHPADARMPWKTPATPGHYCLQVLLVWIDDLNPANNLGQNNLDVVAAHSPAQFSFKLRNAGDKPRTYAFEVDTYKIPDPELCKATIGPEDRGTFTERLRRIQARHDRSLFPVPPGWSIDIQPASPHLLAKQEIDVAVAITPPDGFTGEMPFNVNALFEGAYAGGVTLTVSKA